MHTGDASWQMGLDLGRWVLTQYDKITAFCWEILSAQHFQGFSPGLPGDSKNTCQYSLDPKQDGNSVVSNENGKYLPMPFFVFVLFFYCFIVLCLSAVPGSKSATCMHVSPHRLEPRIPLPIPLPILLLQVITEHQAELPVRYSRFPLAVCFTPGSVPLQSQSPYPSHPPLPALW